MCKGWTAEARWVPRDYPAIMAQTNIIHSKPQEKRAHADLTETSHKDTVIIETINKENNVATELLN